MGPLKRTPLFPVYSQGQARLVEFGGWELPVQFAGIREEHLAVRTRAGIFDVSHMGEIRISGPGADVFLQHAAGANVDKIPVGRAAYTVLLNENGGILDDIFIYRLAETDFLLCVNAANTDKDFAWLLSLDHPGVELCNESALWAQIALQGPLAPALFQEVSGVDYSSLSRHAIIEISIAGVKVLAACSGYTGEPGPELFIPSASAVIVWETLLRAGKEIGLQPAGLGARDTLRLEMGYPLHGHDITPETTPVEADLMITVDMEKKDFIGRSALARQLEEGPKRKRAGLVMEEPGIAREGCRILTPHGEGRVTSGTKTPSLPMPVAMGYVPGEDARPDTEVRVEIRGQWKRARLASFPFYRKRK